MTFSFVQPGSLHGRIRRNMFIVYNRCWGVRHVSPAHKLEFSKSIHSVCSWEESVSVHPPVSCTIVPGSVFSLIFFVACIDVQLLSFLPYSHSLFTRSSQARSLPPLTTIWWSPSVHGQASQCSLQRIRTAASGVSHVGVSWATLG